MVKDKILDLLNRFLDEATENESFSFNRTDYEDYLQECSDNAIYTMKYLVEGVLMFCIGSLGIIFNTVSVVFFIRQKSQRTFHRLLLLLAVVDTVHLVTSLLSFSLPTLHNPFLQNTYQYTLPYTLPIAQTTLVMSVYMTISLTVERYLSVVHPILALSYRSSYSFLLLAGPGMFFSLLFTLPNYFILTTKLVHTDQEENELLQLIANDSLLGTSLQPDVPQPGRMKLVWAHWRYNQAFTTVYVLWFHLLFVTLIPFTLLFWLNKTIHRKLSERLNTLRRTGHEALRRRELRLARVSMGIVLLYMLCHCPKLVPTVCEIMYSDAKVIPSMVEVSHLLLVVNCSLNFPTYFVASGSSISDIFSRQKPSPCRWKTTSSDLSVTSKFTLTVSLQMLSIIQPSQQMNPSATSSS